MAEVIRMPKMSDTMTEGVIQTWLKKVGDDIKPGDILAEVETDKATMELENYVKGTLLHIGIEAGGTVPVDAVIAIVGQKGEDISALLASAGSAPAAKTEEKPTETVATPAATVASASLETTDSRVKASPLAKKIAEEKGIDITKVPGSGDNGRIVKKDIENFKGAPAAKQHMRSQWHTHYCQTKFEEAKAILNAALTPQSQGNTFCSSGTTSEQRPESRPQL